jgi:hypothetical protein
MRVLVSAVNAGSLLKDTKKVRVAGISRNLRAVRRGNEPELVPFPATAGTAFTFRAVSLREPGTRELGSHRSPLFSIEHVDATQQQKFRRREKIKFHP